eukprot:6566074-Prymnesium_polylepis.1
MGGLFLSKPSCNAHQPRKVQWWPVRRRGARRRGDGPAVEHIGHCDGHRGRESPNGETLGSWLITSAKRLAIRRFTASVPVSRCSTAGPLPRSSTATYGPPLDFA